jgi:hypothetical protein
MKDITIIVMDATEQFQTKRSEAKMLSFKKSKKL